LDLSIINIQLKEKIENRISYPKENSEDIRKFIVDLLKNVKVNKSIKIYFNLQTEKKNLEYIFHSFNDSIRNKDQPAIHYLGRYLRVTLIKRVHLYINSLAIFRHKSLVSMKTFEKSTHQYLVNFIRESIENRNDNHHLANETINYFNSKNL
jgi:hypothetical protein